MKNSIFTLLFLLFTASIIAQNQQGWLTLVDKTPDGLVYYVSSLFECKFPGDHDGIDAQRKAFDAKFKTYLLENYELVDFQNQDNEWMEPGRGVYPAKNYSTFLEYFPVRHEDAKLIMVQDFKLNCPK